MLKFTVTRLSSSLLHINEQSVFKLYKLHSDSATVGVLRELLNCRDDINTVKYFNYDEVPLIIEELCTHYYMCAYNHLYYRVFFSHTVFCFCIWYVLLYSCTNKDDDDDCHFGTYDNIVHD